MISMKVLSPILAVLLCGQVAADEPALKIYILAGQSNMEGHAKIETFDYLGDDPATVPLLKEMRGADGQPRVCDRVWISYFTGSGDQNGEGLGKLTAGFGSRRNPAESGGKIGPEFTFGITMEKAARGPVLIIKTAWGGKSLNTDFRPPSGGPYVLNAFQKELYAKQGKDLKAWEEERAKATGHYYRLMIGHVKKVLADLPRVCPAYDAKRGHELAGFLWFQGWNDLVDSHTYPDRAKPDGYALYAELMAHFIRDVRKDLSAPKLPFVIDVMGVGGPLDQMPEGQGRTVQSNFRAAMAAPAALPEFKGNVVAVQTAPFWDLPLGQIESKMSKVKEMASRLKAKGKDTPNADGKMSPQEQEAWMKEFRAKTIPPEDEERWKRGASNGGYHYLGCAKTLALIGQTSAKAILEMEPK